MAGSGSNTLRAVLNELGWSYSRLAAELRRHASVALPKTEALALAMEVSVLEAKRLGHRAVLQIWCSVSVSRSIRSPEDATTADARVLPMSKKATAPASSSSGSPRSGYWLMMAYWKRGPAVLPLGMPGPVAG